MSEGENDIDIRVCASYRKEFRLEYKIEGYDTIATYVILLPPFCCTKFVSSYFNRLIRRFISDILIERVMILEYSCAMQRRNIRRRRERNVFKYAIAIAIVFHIYVEILHAGELNIKQVTLLLIWLPTGSEADENQRVTHMPTCSSFDLRNNSENFVLLIRINSWAFLLHYNPRLRFPRVGHAKTKFVYPPIDLGYTVSIDATVNFNRT